MNGRSDGELSQHPAPQEALSPGEDSTEQAAPNDLGIAEEDAWDQWRPQLINEGGNHRGAEAVLLN